MSIRVSGVYLVPSQVIPGEKAGNNVTTKTVAIVTPQRSNSLDYLNFEEKRQIIASSLSLSEFLGCGNQNKDGVTTVIVGEWALFIAEDMCSPAESHNMAHTLVCYP